MAETEKRCWHEIMDEDILEIYKAYDRKRYIGKKPALLLVDLYNLAYAGGPRPVTEVIKEHPSSCGIHAWNAIEPTKELIAIARENNMPIFYATRGLGKVRATNRQMNNELEDSYEIKEEFRPQENDVMVHKERASCLFGTPLSAYLTQQGVDTLIICGQSTSGCVRATAVDSFSHGFHTVVVEDCTFDRNQVSHKASLFDLHHKYADVLSIEQVKQHFQK